MDDAAEERHRLDILHEEELLRTRKAQEQTRDHIAQIQAQARGHHKLMLDLEHDAAITRQKALHEENYQHRERILKLEQQYASAGSGVERGEPIPELQDTESRNEATVEPGRGLMMASENAGSSNVAAVEGKEGLAAPRDAGSGRGSSGDNVPKKSSRVEYFKDMARKAADRSVEKRG